MFQLKLPTPPRWRRVAGFLLLAAALASTVLMAREIAAYAQLRQAAIAAIRQQAAATLQSVIQELTHIAAHGAEATERAAQLADQAAVLSADDLETGLRDVARRYPTVAQVGLIFDPFTFDPEVRLFAPLAERQPSGVAITRLEDDMDPTTLPLYQRSLTTPVFWNGPSRTLLSGGAPMLFQVRRGNGFTAWATFRAADITGALDAAQIVGGMAMLLNPDGKILVIDRAARLDQAHAILTQGPTANRHMLRAAVPESPWQVVLAVSTAKAARNEAALKPLVMRLTAGVLVLVLSVAGMHLLCFKKSGGVPVRALWLWSYGIAFLFVAAIAAIWSYTLLTPPARLTNGHVINGPAALADFKRQTLIAAVENHQPIPKFVATGLFIQGVEFASANYVVVSGYIWQRFPGVAPESAPQDPGFMMPEADTVDISELYRRAAADGTIIGWSFRAAMRQGFSYARFPLDWESVWVRLWAHGLDDDVILVPDFDGYFAHGDNPLTGVADDIVIGGWTPRQAFFDYRHHDYNANFGRADRETGAHPELYFNVVLQHTFLDAFVSHMTPIILVLVLIFAMQMTVSRNDDHRDLLGFNAATIITTCAALFFAVLISHIEVRGALAAKQVFYIEYFYFITYLVILLACVNAILFTDRAPIKFVHYEDNLIPKLLYWPTVTAAMYGVTVIVFV